MSTKEVFRQVMEAVATTLSGFPNVVVERFDGDPDDAVGDDVVQRGQITVLVGFYTQDVARANAQGGPLFFDLPITLLVIVPHQGREYVQEDAELLDDLMDALLLGFNTETFRPQTFGCMNFFVTGQVGLNGDVDWKGRSLRYLFKRAQDHG